MPGSPVSMCGGSVCEFLIFFTYESMDLTVGFGTLPVGEKIVVMHAQGS